MSEGDVISKTFVPNTVETIFRQLSTLGIRRGDTVLVHSSLSALGWVCGGAQAVIMAFLKALGEDGTLVMPAHSGDWSDPAEWNNPPVPADWVQIIYDNMPAFDPAITPTRGMGRIAELFRTFPDTIRSNHPQVSFCANGKLAGEILSNHPLTPQLGMNSPLGRLYTLNSWVLLLGVDYNSCTCFHLAETLIDKMPTVRQGTAIVENGYRVWKYFDDFSYSTDDFWLLGKHFEESGGVRMGKIGNACCRLFKIRDAVDFAIPWIREHRFGKHGTWIKS